MLGLVKKYMPPTLLEGVKKVAGSAGHSGGLLDGWRARRLGKASKSPSRLARFVKGRLMDFSCRQWEGTTVMEYGGGFLMAESLIYSLLGAREVVIVDYYAIAKTEILREYARRADWQEARSIAEDLRGLEKVEDWFCRLRRALSEKGTHWFESLGIRYVAPFDVVSQSVFPPRSFGMIVSQSTLEHVPKALAPSIVASIADLVAPGGGMYHYIHLEDHRDFANHPFEFLRKGTDYCESHSDMRGNRIRASEWRRLFMACDGFMWKEYPHPIRCDVCFPTVFEEPFEPFEREDLFTSHLALAGVKGESG